MKENKMGGKFQVGASPVSVVRVFQRNKNSRMDGQIDRWIEEWMRGHLFQGIGFTQLHLGAGREAGTLWQS